MGETFNMEDSSTLHSATMSLAENQSDKAASEAVNLEDFRLGSKVSTRAPSVNETEGVVITGQYGRDLERVDSVKKLVVEMEMDNTATEVVYPSGTKLGLVTLALCLSVFLMALDNTIIATAIPAITDQFQSLPDVGWYGSAYLLTTASFQLLFGKFYTFFSIKWVFLIAIGIFEIGSLICGVAPSSTVLIVGRAIAGIGGAGIFSGALIIIAYSIPLAKRPMYTGFVGAMYGIASVAGPLLGGIFTDKITWRWCFYINLPLGAITVVIITLFFHSPERAAVAHLGSKDLIKEFDLEGTAVFIPAIVCLLLALQWGGTKYPWSDGKIIGLLVTFGVLLVIFIAIQFWKQDSATVPPKILAKRSMAAATWFSFTLGSAFLLLLYYLPLWFQAVKGASAVKSGIMNIPLVMTLVIASLLAGIGVTLLGYYAPLMIVSSVLTAIGIGLLYTFKTDTDHSRWIGFQAITGIGIGIGLQQPLIAAQTVLDISQIPIGTSIIIFVQTLGGALFVSVGQSVFTNKLTEGITKYAPSLDPAIILKTGATSIQKTIDKAVLPGVTQAYNEALTQAFLVAAVMGTSTILGSLAIEWKSVKGKKIEMGAA